MTMFEKNNLFIVVVNVGLCLMAAAFASEVAHNGTPIKPETYGEIAYAIPAIVWSLIQFVAAFIASIGAYIQGRVGAWLVVVFNSILAVLCGTFGVLAVGAVSGSIVVWGSFFLSMPLSALGAILALRHLRLGE